MYANEIVPFVKKEKGNLDCRLLEPTDRSDNFISMTVWDNKEDADAYHSSGDYKKLVDKVKVFFTKDAVLKTYKTEGVMEQA